MSRPSLSGDTAAIRDGSEVRIAGKCSGQSGHHNRPLIKEPSPDFTSPESSRKTTVIASRGALTLAQPYIDLAEAMTEPYLHLQWLRCASVSGESLELEL